MRCNFPKSWALDSNQQSPVDGNFGGGELFSYLKPHHRTFLAGEDTRPPAQRLYRKLPSWEVVF